MRLARTLIATVATAALVAAPVASASAASHKPAPKPRFVISALQIIGKSSYDVAHSKATVRFRVQVKDFDKKFDPTQVKVVVVKKSDSSNSMFTVLPHRVGRSRVVTNWLGTITVPQATAPSAPVEYCLVLVKAADTAAPYTSDVTVRAKSLPGRDCFTVTNSLK